MNNSFVDEHIARKKMQLKNSNACLSFVTTLWRGEVIMCCFDNLNNEIADVFCIQLLAPEDITTLEKLIKDFIYDF